MAGHGRRRGTHRTLTGAVGPTTAKISLPPEEQYLVQSGRTYFRGMAFDDLRRAQIDLETTGLDPARDRVLLAAVRSPDGTARTLEGDEAAVIAAIVAWVRDVDPDVIGGIVVRVGNSILDASIRARLEQLRKQVAHTV